MTSSACEGPISDTTALLLIEALNEKASSRQYHSEIDLINDGTTWQPEDVSSLINAFLGDLDTAMEVMR